MDSGRHEKRKNRHFVSDTFTAALLDESRTLMPSVLQKDVLCDTLMFYTIISPGLPNFILLFSRFLTFHIHPSPPLLFTTVKDPNAPKKPLSAYMNFAKQTRPKIVKENPAFTFGEVGKELGAQWGKLSQAQKDKFKAAE